MLVTYLRSSSIGTYEMCEQKYFCTYVLGLKDKDNAKAIMGSVVHKNLELLGKYKIGLQKKPKTKHFVDEEFGKITHGKMTLEYLNDISHAFYEKEFPGLMPKNAKKITLDWTNIALTRLDGEMDPRKQDIHAVEEFFEIEIPHEWAKISYQVGDKKIEGQLGIKGTVDLILKEDDVYFHIIDYKTGRRYNWATQEIKTYDKLSKDHQLLLYYYALRMKYPDKKFYVSIYYINNHEIDKQTVEGGLFTFAFDDTDFANAENMLKQKFLTIKNNKSPRLLNNSCSDFRCKYMCNFSQIIPEISTTKPACLHLRDEIREKGIDAVTARYADLSKITTYSGGGRINVDLKIKDE